MTTGQDSIEQCPYASGTLDEPSCESLSTGDQPADLAPSKTHRYYGAMNTFTPQTLIITFGSAVVAFAVLYWAMDVELVVALGTTAIYAVLALVMMYFKSKNST